MALARLLFRIDGNNAGFRAATEDSINQAQRLDRQMATVQGTFAGVGAAAFGLLSTMQEILAVSEQLDREVLDSVVFAGLVGGDTATAQAFSVTRELTGVGGEQAFDVAEAIADALRVKGDVARPLAEDIGLDPEAFLAESDPAERFYQILDALVERGGAVDDTVLQAASELGAGDIRDVSTLAGLVSRDPTIHPRFAAEQFRAGAISEEQTTDIVGRTFERERYRALGRQQLATEPWWNIDRLWSILPGMGDRVPEQVGRRLAEEGEIGGWDLGIGGARLGRIGGETRVVITLDESARREGIRATVMDMHERAQTPLRTTGD